MSSPIVTPTAAQDIFADYSAYEEAGFDLETLGFNPSALDEQSIEFFIPSQKYYQLSFDKCDNESHWMGLTQESSGLMPMDLPPWPSVNPEFSTENLLILNSFDVNSGASLGDFPVSPEAIWSPLSSQIELSPVLSIGGLSPEILDLTAAQFVDETSSQSFSTSLLFSAGPEQYDVASSTAQPISHPTLYLHAALQRSESSTDTPYRCGVGSCGYTSSKIYNVKRHRSTTHEKSRPGFKCSFCPKIMGRKDNINQHMRTCRLKPASDCTNTSSTAPTASQAVIL